MSNDSTIDVDAEKKANVTIYQNLTDLSHQYPALLDDFKKYYIQYKTHPQNTDYKNTFDTSQTRLKFINDQLSSILLTMQNKIEKLNNIIKLVDVNIKTEKDKNTNLTHMYNDTAGTDNGSLILKENTYKKYKLQYVYNVGLFIGILLILITMYIIY